MAALPALPLTANTQAKVRISKKKLTLEVADKYALKLKGAKGRVVWKSSKPKVAKVNKKGKVTALKKGKTTITARMGKRKYKCVISVYNNTKRNENPIKEPQVSDMPIPATTQTPTQTPTPTQAPSYSVFSQCYVSDIGKNYIEISDEANRLIYYFEYDCAPSRIIYDGKVTILDQNSYNIEGESINYSDIHVGDKVDIVYCYSEYSELSDIYCDAINVYKR